MAQWSHQQFRTVLKSSVGPTPHSLLSPPTITTFSPCFSLLQLVFINMNTNRGAQKLHYPSDTTEDRYIYQCLGDLQQHELEQSVSFLFLWAESVFKGQK